MKDDKKMFFRHAIKQTEKDFMDADIDLSKGASVSIKRSANVDTQELQKEVTPNKSAKRFKKK